MRIRFLLICEGSSDTALVSHIQALLIHCGASEADGTASFRGRRVRDKVRLGLQYYGSVKLLFVHRDADKASSDTRYEEIRQGISAAGYDGRWIGVVPVRMMEAWLLADEAAIRRVAGRPRGTEPLDLPVPDELENIPDPKETLREVLMKAGAPRGVRRRKRLKADLGNLRKQPCREPSSGRFLGAGRRLGKVSR